MDMWFWQAGDIIQALGINDRILQLKSYGW